MRLRRNPFKRSTSPSYATEAELCQVLAAQAREEGWVPYPETGGWDLLLVRPRDGFQVGVQAKLRPNVDVLAQALVAERSKGPEVHAVLVPSCSDAFRKVARDLRLLVLEGANLDASWRAASGMGARGMAYTSLEYVVPRAPLHHHVQGRCWVPPFVPQLPAGVPGPRQVTQWQVGAAKLCALLRERGAEGVTRAEATALGLSFTRWEQAWLNKVPGTKPARYVPVAGIALPDEDFPYVAAGLGLPQPRRVAA